MVEPDRQTITAQQYKDANRAHLYYAKRLCDALQDTHPHLEITVDEVVALNIAVATYDDIDRFKSYHLRNTTPQQRSDVVKRAAYFAKWITKLRPIMIRRLDSSAHDPDVGLMLNEVFAVAWALELISSETGTQIKFTRKAHADLLYDLHYREMGDDALLSLFQLVVDLAKAQKENPIIEFATP